MIETFPHRTAARAAGDAWLASLDASEHLAAAYIAAAFPHLSAQAGPDGRPVPTRLAFNLQAFGAGRVTVQDPYCATLELTGLDRDVCAAVHNRVFPDGGHFSVVNAAGHLAADVRDCVAGSYAARSQGRDHGEDLLVVRPDGTADITLHGLGINIVALALVAMREANDRLDAAVCTRCSMPYWRHRMLADTATCQNLYTRACSTCRDAGTESTCPGGVEPCRSSAPSRTPLEPWQVEQSDAALAPLLEVFNGWDLRSLVTSAVELFGESGDPNDVLSSSQKEAIERAATLLDALSEAG